METKLRSVVQKNSMPVPDRTPVKRWAKIRLWTGYLYILCAIIFARPLLVWAIVGFILVLLGVSVRLIASATLVKDKELVTHGIYSMTRNPLYLGSSLIALGFASMSSSLWILAACIFVLMPLYIRMISIEEKYLTKLFPGSYPAYLKSAPKFTPDLSKIGGIPGTLDKSLVKRNEELTTTILFIILSVILLVLHRSWLPG